MSTHDFKPDEIIELINNPTKSMPLGTRVKVIASINDNPVTVCYENSNGDRSWRPAAYFKRVITSPIKVETVTVKSLVEGNYGRLNINNLKNKDDEIGINFLHRNSNASVSLDWPAIFNAEELRQMSNTLIALVEFLEEKK